MNDAGFRRKRKDTTPIPWRMAQDKALSMEATAVVTYLMTKPDGWKGRNFDIEERFGIGEKLRRRAVKEAEQAGWLALRRVRHPTSGQIDSFYEVQDAQPLSEAERTRSEDMPSVPIWTWAKFLSEYEMPPDTPPPPPGGGGHPPRGQGVAGQGVGGQGVVAGGDIDNKELDLRESKKEEEGEPSPLLPLLIKKFGTDPLSGRKDRLKEPAIRVTVAFHRAKSPNTKPTDSRFFLPDLDTFANALGYHGLQHEQRVLDEIALEARDRNELPFDLLKRLGLGPAPKGPHPSWDDKVNAMVEGGLKQVKARLMRLEDRPHEMATGDGQKYRRTAADCVWIALNSFQLPKEAKKAIGDVITADVGFMYAYQVSMAAQLAREKLLNTKEKLTVADAINSLDWYDVRVLHAAMTTLTADQAFQKELEERRKARKRPKPRDPFREGAPDPRPAFQKGTVR